MLCLILIISVSLVQLVKSLGFLGFHYALGDSFGLEAWQLGAP